ncbi:MAG: DNA polymerase III subunit beta [Gammaproteobacteria bacterium]
MKFKIQREQLLKPLQMISGVVERRQTLPILSNVLIVVDSHLLSLTATDLEVELSTRAVLSEPAEVGQVTVSARKLMDICRSAPDKALLELSTNDKKVIIKSGRSRFSLAILPVEDFPLIEEEKSIFEFSLIQQDLLKLLNATHFSMGQQDVRGYLNGVLLLADQDIIRVVASDGHRLAMSTHNDNENDTAPESQSTIMPRKAVIELVRLLENVDEKISIALTANHIRLVTKGFTFISKLIDESTPNYDAIIPDEGDKVITIDRDVLKAALARVSILSNEQHRGIRICLSPQLLQLISNNPDQEEAEEELDIEYAGSALEIGFNVDYLIDILGVVPQGDVRLFFADPSSSLLIKSLHNEQALYVVMPMKL